MKKAILAVLLSVAIMVSVNAQTPSRGAFITKITNDKSKDKTWEKVIEAGKTIWYYFVYAPRSM